MAHSCDSVHSVPEGAGGSVDLLIPASWSADDDAHEGPPLETVGDPAKFVICGPHNGFIEYAVWAPPSADPGDVTVSPDRARLTILATSGSGSALDPRPDPRQRHDDDLRHSVYG